jgi:hypothetical protein
MARRLKKQFKQQRALESELNFENFCQKNNIEYKKIDDSKSYVWKKKFLKNVHGKCPDFWCKIKNKEIFVEIKTLTNLTNEKREISIEKEIKKIKNNGLPGGMVSEVFSPTPEIEGPFTTFLKDSSSKFKNLKDELSQPRILFINKIFGSNIRFAINALFLGAYDSYKKESGKLVYAGLNKTKRGLFDKTGSNVSAVIYWNKERKHFQCAANSSAKISFSGDYFNAFFDKK